MFVRKSKFDAVQRQREVNANAYWQLQREYHALDNKHDELVERLNNLVRKVNDNGGVEMIGKRSQFTDSELRSLLQLVHPDKHDGKESAKILTQKINQLRA
jgi:hypothetical protein